MKQKIFHLLIKSNPFFIQLTIYTIYIRFKFNKEMQFQIGRLTYEMIQRTLQLMHRHTLCLF